VSRNKICPECKTEYLPHIEKCADCGAALLLPEELGKFLEEKRRIRQTAVQDTAVVREGDLDWLSELRTVLTDAGIPSAVRAASNCGQGCCGGAHRLVVSARDLQRAQERIEEYFMEVNPEVRASKELLQAGKCPACSSPVAADSRECPDCGLPLVIVEEEEE
jgi:rRNA maturation endonuclease Nob1